MTHSTPRARLGALTGVLALFALLLGTAPLAQAQATGTVTGTVLDGVTDEPIPGASVRLDGTTRGASTDLDGTYTIAGVPDGPYRLTVSFIGYRTYATDIQIQAGQTTVENVTIEIDRTGLDEVVVTGQGGGVERRRLSTTVESINARDIAEIPAVQLEDILQANLPNAQIRFSSGQAGTASLIRSRGVTSANSSTTPVIYIDGVRVDNLNSNSQLNIATGGAASSALADIPVENIERIEFIKGGAATTLYGSDAANGVLQIFTKQGVPGRSQFTVETQLGAETATTDYLRFDRTADVLYDPGFIQGYRLSGTGGGQGTTYSFSGRIYENQGFQLNGDNQRYDLRTTLATKLSDLLKYTGSFAYTSNFYSRNLNANFGGGLQSLETGDSVILSELDADEFNAVRDSVRLGIDLYRNDFDIQRFQTSQQLDLSILPSLDARFIAGVDYRFSDNFETVTNEYLIQDGQVAEGTDNAGSLDNVQRRVLGLTLDGNASHRFEVGGLSFVTQLGGQLFRDQDEQLRVTASNVVEGAQSLEDAAEQSIQDFERTVVNYGVYLAENIGIYDRLFVDVGGRIDGNTAFGDDVGAVFYPRVGAAYTLSDEAFFQRAIPRSILSNLKLRANYGEAGNFPTPFANDRTIAVNTFLATPTYTFGQPGDPNLRPERIKTYEIGADLGLFNERLSFEASYYDKTTDDALFNAPFAPSVGQINQVRNLGQVVNRGFELNSTAYLVDQRDVTVRMSASFNTLYNEVTDTGGAPQFFTGGFTLLGGQVVEGEPVGVLISDLPRISEDGVIERNTGTTPIMLGETEIAPGRALVEQDVNVGNPLPDYFGALNLSTRIKRFTFLVSADYQFGAQAASLNELLGVLRDYSDVRGATNTAGERTSLREGFLANDPAALARIDELAETALRRSTGELVPAKTVVLAGLGVQGYDLFSLAGLFVEDTDYVKIRQISASYSVPPSLLSRVGVVNGARIQLAVTNPFNFVTSTFDPEITGSGVAAQGGVNTGGFGYGTESAPRQYIVTLGVDF